jgi:hypothetical protein
MKCSDVRMGEEQNKRLGKVAAAGLVARANKRNNLTLKPQEQHKQLPGAPD